MIIIKIIMNVIPEKQKELVQTLLPVIAAMEKEEGCLNQTLFCAIENNNRFILLMEWQTRKCLDRHLRSKMFGVLLGTRSLLDEPHAIFIYTVHRSEGMEAVHTARGKDKEIAGKVTDNPDLETEGRTEGRAGKVQEKVGDVNSNVA